MMYYKQDIGKLISLSANAVKELYKTNPSNETVEYTTKDFVKTLDVRMTTYLSS